MYNVITNEKLQYLMELYDRLSPDQQIVLENYLDQLCEKKES